MHDVSQDTKSRRIGDFPGAGGLKCVLTLDLGCGQSESKADVSLLADGRFTGETGSLPRANKQQVGPSQDDVEKIGVEGEGVG